MPNTIQPTTLQELLNSTQQVNNLHIVNLYCTNSSNSFLMQRVLDRLKQQFKSKALFLNVSEPSATKLKTELQSKKNPTILFIQQGEIQKMFGGVVPFLELSNAINSLI